jgi:hypothetical protein
VSLFKRKSYEEEQAAVLRCPNCHEPIVDGELECGMCGNDLRGFLEAERASGGVTGEP